MTTTGVRRSLCFCTPVCARIFVLTSFDSVPLQFLILKPTGGQYYIIQAMKDMNICTHAQTCADWRIKTADNSSPGTKAVDRANRQALLAEIPDY